MIFSVLLSLVLLANCSLPPYSQEKIMRKSRQMLADSGEYYLERRLVRDKRISLDSLAVICAPNIGEYDSVRGAIFACLFNVKDTSILKLMGIKAVSGNTVERLSASAYIYNYYGVKMLLGQDVPLASLLLLFHSTAENLSKNINSFQYYANIDRRREIALTFPETESLYKEFIFNSDLHLQVRTWFVESLQENKDREMVVTFLLGIEAELSEGDMIRQAVEETVYTVINRGTKGDWISGD